MKHINCQLGRGVVSADGRTRRAERCNAPRQQQRDAHNARSVVLLLTEREEIETKAVQQRGRRRSKRCSHRGVPPKSRRPSARHRCATRRRRREHARPRARQRRRHPNGRSHAGDTAKASTRAHRNWHCTLVIRDGFGSAKAPQAASEGRAVVDNATAAEGTGERGPRGSVRIAAEAAPHGEAVSAHVPLRREVHALRCCRGGALLPGALRLAPRVGA